FDIGPGALLELGGLGLALLVQLAGLLFSSLVGLFGTGFSALDGRPKPLAQLLGLLRRSDARLLRLLRRGDPRRLRLLARLFTILGAAPEHRDHPQSTWHDSGNCTHSRSLLPGILGAIIENPRTISPTRGEAIARRLECRNRPHESARNDIFASF